MGGAIRPPAGYLKRENGMGHHLQLGAGGDTVPAGANAVAGMRRTASPCLLPARRYAMLSGKTGFQFAARACGPRAVQSSNRPVFTSRSSFFGLDFAGK